MGFQNMDVSLEILKLEEDLIKACCQNESWAQEQIYERYFPTMMGVCLRYASNRDDARDLLHEGFLKVFTRFSSYRPGTSLSAWIHRIMVNTCIDDYRRNARRKTESLDRAAHWPSLNADPVSHCNTTDILEMISQLSPVYRTVFNLFAIEGFSHREIANQLGITESTSRSNLAKARQRLKKMFFDNQRKYG